MTFVPHDRSSVWTRQDEYFTTRGVNAWTHGDIPFLSTNNRAIARQNAALLVALARSIPPEEKVHVLEIGGGLGTFAANLHHALDEDLGDEGRALAGRLQYVFSDYAPATLRDASWGPELAPLCVAGRVTPMLYDIRRPGVLRSPDGATASPPRFAAVLSNYVCCVVPGKIVQRGAGGYQQLSVSGSGDEQEIAFRPASLEEIFPQPHHRRILLRVIGALEEATVIYPEAYLDFLVGVKDLLRPDGLVVVTDYGKVSSAALRGLRTPEPEIYGSSVNYDVYFTVFDAFAEETGAAVLRTSDPIGTVHTALVGRPPIEPAVAEAFQACFVARHEGQELLDMVAAARRFLDGREWSRAVRFFARAIALDPLNAELHLRMGQVHIEAGRHEQALDALRRGLELDVWRRYDFQFEMGRALSRLGRHGDAIRCYEASIDREPHPVTLTNLATIHEANGDLRAAYRCYKQALELEPEHEDAIQRLDRMKDVWWNRTMADLDKET